MTKQSLQWYLNRLYKMDAEEIAWRLLSRSNDSLDRIKSKLGIIPNAPTLSSEHLTQPRLSRTAGSDLRAVNSEWYRRLVDRAEGLKSKSFTFFDLDGVFFGQQIDWQKDYSSGRSAPLIHSSRINYRDFEANGDCKLIWEPNRQHHLVVLGRAYAASGDSSYAREVVDQIGDWIRQNPYGIGINWRSPLELGIRLINWIWAYDLVLTSGMLDASFNQAFLQSVYQHCYDIRRKFSRGSSANNHLVGEAAGLYIAACYFEDLPDAEEWKSVSRSFLVEQVEMQSFADGGTREQAPAYQFFVLQFFLISALVGKRLHEPFPASYLERIRTMLAFLRGMTEGGSRLPMIGDCDDGYVLDLGDPPTSVKAMDEMLSLLLEEVRTGDSETFFWLGGEQHSLDSRRSELSGLTSRCYPDSGYYLLQAEAQASRPKVSVVIDCGPLGFEKIAAHGHADALSFILRLDGEDVFVDPGTYDYFTHPQWRSYFRSTKAHNTVVVDETDQSQSQGPFMWGAHAEATCIEWQPTDQGGSFQGSHDGYRRLSDPVEHKRRVQLDAEAGTLTLQDQITCRNSHHIAIYFHLSEGCEVVSMEQQTCLISLGRHRIELALEPDLELQRLHGSVEPIGGWLSRRYHCKRPISTIIGSLRVVGSRQLTTRISW